MKKQTSSAMNWKTAAGVGLAALGLHYIVAGEGRALCSLATRVANGLGSYVPASVSASLSLDQLPYGIGDSVKEAGKAAGAALGAGVGLGLDVEGLVLLLLVLTVLCYSMLDAAYDFFFRPLWLKREYEEPEASLEGDKYPGKRARRYKGQTPPPYPNAWFKVCNSFEIKKGECRDFELFGCFIAVYRGEDGKVRALDAYCPHMGANLAVTGKVAGNDIVCPFHGWQFDGEDGRCTHIPYTDKVPGFIKTNTWAVDEVNDSILIWHDAEGRPPMWHTPPIPQVNGPSSTYRWHGATLHHVRAHIQEIPENGADFAHLNFLHEPLTWSKLQNWLGHKWEAKWEPGQGVEEHVAHISVVQKLTFLGREVPGTCIRVTILQAGPGQVHLSFATPLGNVICTETVTPVQPMLQRVQHQCWAERRVPRWFAKLLLRGLIVQFERDVPIWNNKIFIHNPLLIKDDGPIAKYRRWFAKNFYSPSSEKVAQTRSAAAAGSMDW